MDIRATVTIQDNVAAVKTAVDQAAFRNLGHGAAALRLIARRSIRRARGPSARGTPPHTQTRRLPTSILYDVQRNPASAIVGPVASIVGPAGSEQEHGWKRGQASYPARPFMEPALEKAAPRLPPQWAASVY
jgi:hypothetical protein